MARPGAGWRVRGTWCSSSMARMRSARTARASLRQASSDRRLSPSRSCSGSPLLLPPRAVLARDAPGPAGLEDDGREDAGQHGRLGPGQDVGPERLGDQEIGLVVDAGEPAARPASRSSPSR